MTAPANDNFADAEPLSGLGTIGSIELLESTIESGEPNLIDGLTVEASVWFTWSPEDDGHYRASHNLADYGIAVYTASGTAFADLAIVAEDADFTGPKVAFDAISTETYFIQIGGPSGYAAGSLTIVSVPMNDNFADAEELTGTGLVVSGFDTSGATLELDEPLVYDSSWPEELGWGTYDTQIGATVWFTWSPSSAGAVEVSTEGSDFDTVIAAYTASGTAFADLTLVAANDEAIVDEEGNDISYPPGWSRITFTGDPDETYYFQVGGYNGNSGSLELTITASEAPGNDAFANAETITLTGGSATISGSNLGASTESGEPLTFAGYGGTVSSTVWWDWTADADGVATFDTFGSDFDTTAAAYTGGSVSGLTTLAFNDDYVGGTATIPQSAISWSADDGVTYSLQVGSSGAGQGSISGHLAFTPYPTGTTPDPPPDLSVADAYRIELRSLNSAGFDVTTESLELTTFSCNWRLNGPGAFEGAGVIGTTQADAANVGARELIVYKGDVAIWGGYLTFFDVDEDTKRIRVGAEGYWSRARARLMRGNQIYKPLTNSGVPWKADVIAWDIIDQAQGATYGDMGWVHGGHSGTRKNCKRIYYGVDRNNVGEAIEALAREGYFDFSVDVRQSPAEGDVAMFRTWYKRGSNLSGSVNLSASNAMTLNYSVASSDMATVIDVFGSVEGCRGVAATETANLSTYGRLEARPIDMETDEQAEVDETASEFIDQHSVPARNASVTYLEGVGPDLVDFDLGDTIRVTPGDGYVSYFDGRVVGRELSVEAARAVITVEVER